MRFLPPIGDWIDMDERTKSVEFTNSYRGLRGWDSFFESDMNPVLGPHGQMGDRYGRVHGSLRKPVCRNQMRQKKRTFEHRKPRTGADPRA